MAAACSTLGSASISPHEDDVSDATKPGTESASDLEPASDELASASSPASLSCTGTAADCSPGQAYAPATIAATGTSVPRYDASPGAGQRSA